jgi:hypothetical protein
VDRQAQALTGPDRPCPNGSRRNHSGGSHRPEKVAPSLTESDIWALRMHGWAVLEGTLDRSRSVIRKHLHPAHEAAEEIAEGIAGVIAGFETLDSREPAKRGVASNGDSGRLGATSLKPISVAYPTPCMPQFRD